jgi:predicted MPP superfamily phosphohydrolase
MFGLKNKQVIKSIRHLSRLAFVSDIHLERIYWGTDYPLFKIKQNESIDNIEGIALLGDIGNPGYDNYHKFLAYCSELFKNVYLISGNHEYYLKGGSVFNIKNIVTSRINNAIEKANEKSKKDNIFYLNNSIKEILPNKYIIGTPLWSDHSSSIIETNKYMHNFYKFINNEHYESVRFLESNINKITTQNELKNIDDPNITILTHYLPTFNLISEEYRNIYYINRAQSERYFSNQEKLITYPVKNWLCGHSHSNIDITFNQVNLKMNCFISNKKNNKFIDLKFVYL